MSRKGCLSSSVGEVLVIYPQDREIRNDEVPAFQAELTELIAQAKHGKVVLNFENVEFLCGPGFGVLISVCRRCRAEKLIVKLCGCRGILKKAFELFQIPRLAEFFDSEADALKAFEKKKGWFGW